jgi:hypothetical protein
MYERFTDRARKVMQLANQEAQRFNHEHIGTEHILLGLVKEGTGVAANVLKNLGVDLQKVRLEAEKLVRGGPDVATAGKLPQTLRARNVVEYSMEEAHKLGHSYVGTEHLLLGLLRDDEGASSVILANLGLRADHVRREVMDLLGHAQAPGPAQPLRPWLAQAAAQRGTGEAELPKACPKCGHAPVARVIWGAMYLLLVDLEHIALRKAILGSAFGKGGPRWVCLRCTPAWSEVHSMAFLDYTLQIEKEKALASADFEAAARCRDAQMEIRR